MDERKKSGMTRAQLLKDAELEMDLPSKYTSPKPGSTDRPIPRTARRDFVRDFIPEGEGSVLQKYMNYADQEAREAAAGERRETRGMKKGGKVKKMKKGGTVSSASKRADGIATKGKTKGRFV
jgi:hypothetical protein